MDSTRREAASPRTLAVSGCDTTPACEAVIQRAALPAPPTQKSTITVSGPRRDCMAASAGSESGPAAARRSTKDRERLRSIHENKLLTSAGERRNLSAMKES